MNRIKAWFFLSRAPFHSVGILPYLLGGILVWRLQGHIHWGVFASGLLAVVLVMLATYYAGEYFDYEVDALSATAGKNRFSGGTLVLQSGGVPRRHALWAALLCVVLAGCIGLFIQFHYHTPPYTIPLGAIGIFGGIFYSTRPLQWAYRGIGEIWIGFCYGWLIVATSFYIQTGEIPLLVTLCSLPIAFTIFNVILINEFPDYPADREVGKKNLVVRLGKKRARIVYALASVGAWLSYSMGVKLGVPPRAIAFFTPIFVLSLLTTLEVLKGHYEDKVKLEGICARTLIFNLGTTLSFILAFVL